MFNVSVLCTFHARFFAKLIFFYVYSCLKIVLQRRFFFSVYIMITRERSRICDFLFSCDCFARDEILLSFVLLPSSERFFFLVIFLGHYFHIVVFFIILIIYILWCCSFFTFANFPRVRFYRFSCSNFGCRYKM